MGLKIIYIKQAVNLYAGSASSQQDGMLTALEKFSFSSYGEWKFSIHMSDTQEQVREQLFQSWSDKIHKWDYCCE